MSRVAFVSVRDLGVRYPERRKTLLRAEGPAAALGVSFEIPLGETLALVGESGSGKTTVARAILRLVSAERGEIRVGNVNVLALRGESLRRHRRHVQAVFQDPASSLDPRQTVGASIAEGIHAHDLAHGDQVIRSVAHLLDEVGLDTTDAARFPHELSGGQRQRVAIARALAVNPAFLVLDEAVSALDVTTQARILELFERLRVGRGLTTLFIAHNLAVVQRVASAVAVMYRGRLVERGPAARVFAAPRHPYTRALLAAVPVPDPRRRPRAVPLLDEQPEPPGFGGCPFHARCAHPDRDEACTRNVPPLSDTGHNQYAACIKAHVD